MPTMCHMTHCHVSHDSLPCITWLTAMCHMTHFHVSHDTSMCHMTNYHVSHDSLPCGHMTHCHVPHDKLPCVTLPCVTWHTLMHHITHCHVSHDALLCVTWHTTMCQMIYYHVIVSHGALPPVLIAYANNWKSYLLIFPLMIYYTEYVHLHSCTHCYKWAERNHIAIIEKSE